MAGKYSNYQELELQPSPNVRFITKGPPTAKDRSVQQFRSWLFWTDDPESPENGEIEIFDRYIRARTLPGAARQAIGHMIRWMEKSKKPLDELEPWVRDAILEDLRACDYAIRRKNYEIRPETRPELKAGRPCAAGDRSRP